MQISAVITENFSIQYISSLLRINVLNIKDLGLRCEGQRSLLDILKRDTNDVLVCKID